MLELGAAGNTVWVHGGRFGTLAEARRARFNRLEELRRRWDEQHKKLRELMLMYKVKAAYNDGMASRYQAAQDPAGQVRGGRSAAGGAAGAAGVDAAQRWPYGQARNGHRALELTGLMKPFSTEIWFGDRVAVLGSNGSGSRTSSGCWRAVAPIPTSSTGRSAKWRSFPVAHTGQARLGSRVRPGWFAQTHSHPELLGRTLLEILHRGDHSRTGMGREEASRKLDRYELAKAAEQRFESLSGGQQARFQILLLELSGATLLLLDEPTDNLDLESAEALEHGLNAFEGTVVAVTHDRWFARSFDRFLVFGADGEVYESDEPVWDERRVERAR